MVLDIVDQLLKHNVTNWLGNNFIYSRFILELFVDPIVLKGSFMGDFEILSQILYNAIEQMDVD